MNQYAVLNLTLNEQLRRIWYTTKIESQGQIPLPRPLQNDLKLLQGDTLTLVQIGDTFIATPHALKTPSFTKEFSAIMDEDGVTMADLLAGLEEGREILWRERHSTTA